MRLKSNIYYYKDDKKIKFNNNNNSDLEFNLKEENGHVVGIIKANKNIVLNKVNLVLKKDYDLDDYIFINGYQGWTNTKEFRIFEHLKNINKYHYINKKYSFSSYGDASFKKYSKNVLHGFDYSYIKGKKPLFIYSNNYENAYLIINHNPLFNKIILESDINGLLLKENNSIFVFDFYISDDNLEDNIKVFFNKKISNKNIFGYTSWYNHYQNINEEIIYNNLDALNNKFNLFQIDDGYEEAVGDWLRIDKDKFPNGLNEICNKINEKGLIPGIWLAPFVAEEKSDLFRNHKELFKHDENNQYIKAGSNWSGFYVLDIYNEEAICYIKKFLSFYKELGFKFFKLDFLYAVGLLNYEGKTRAQITSYAYSLLKESLTDCIILGCGAVISSAQNKFDYMRIGPDVSLKFDDLWYMKFMHRERISTKVTIENTISRSIFNNSLFLNDPDVFLLRDNNISLSKKQKEALAIINALFGSLMMTSDNINDYDNEKKEFLNKLLYLHNNKKNLVYYKNNKNIYISYTLDDKENKLIYNVKKGVFVNG